MYLFIYSPMVYIDIYINTIGESRRVVQVSKLAQISAGDSLSGKSAAFEYMMMVWARQESCSLL